MEIFNKTGYIFFLTLFLALINIFFIWEKTPQDNNWEIFLGFFFSFFFYFSISYIFFFLLGFLHYRLPFLFFFFFLFLLYSFFPGTFPENIIYFILIAIFILSLLTSNFFEGFNNIKVPRNSYPLLFFLGFLLLFLIKIFSKNQSKSFMILITFFLFSIFLILIFILNYIKLPNFLYPLGILISLILFFISFFYFFPFNPPPFERKGQNFLIITIEGFRKDCFSHMPQLAERKKEGSEFPSLYLVSPDYRINLEKLFLQKNKCLLDFFPERYQSSFVFPGELKNFEILKNFKDKHFYGEKNFYSIVFENWLFFNLFKNKGDYKIKNIFDLSYEKIKSLNRPFLFWIHIDKLKYSIPEEITVKALKGNIIDPNFIKNFYFKEISTLDFFLENFLSKIQKEKWYEKTNVLVLGVSGFEILEHSKIGTGTGYYQESVEVPFLWFGPHIENKKIGNPISILDIYPTILKKFNLSNDYKKFEGIEFTPAFENIFPLDRIFTFYGNHLYFKGKAFIKEDKKIILKENGEIEVYDLLKDPMEKENIYFKKEDKIIKMVEEVKSL